MKLEYGKRYINHTGKVTDPLEESGDFNYPFRDPASGDSFTEDGEYKDWAISNEDLVSLARDEHDINRQLLILIAKAVGISEYHLDKVLAGEDA